MDIGHKTWNMGIMWPHTKPDYNSYCFSYKKKWIEEKKSVFYDCNIFENKTKMQPNAAQNKHPYKPTANNFKKWFASCSRLVSRNVVDTGQPSEKKMLWLKCSMYAIVMYSHTHRHKSHKARNPIFSPFFSNSFYNSTCTSKSCHINWFR